MFLYLLKVRGTTTITTKDLHADGTVSLPTPWANDSLHANHDRKKSEDKRKTGERRILQRNACQQGNRSCGEERLAQSAPQRCLSLI